MKLCSEDWLGLMAMDPRVARMMLWMWQAGGDKALSGGQGQVIHHGGTESTENSQAEPMVWVPDGSISGSTTEQRVKEAARRDAQLQQIYSKERTRAARAGGDNYQEPKPHYVTPEGVAILSLRGVMMKDPPNKFNGAVAVTKWMRLALAEAKADPVIKAAVLRIDSPGGYTSGTDELAMAIKEFGKPLVASVEDMCASAAYWAASQCTEIMVNRRGYVGSLGTYTVLYDESKAFEAEGITVHVISSGGIKGAGVQGAPVPDGLIAEMQGIVDELTAAFKAAVVSGRKAAGASATRKQIESLFVGSVWGASEAKDLGLVDKIGGLEEAVARAAQLGKTAVKAAKAQAQEAPKTQERARAELRLKMAMGRSNSD